MQSRQIDMVDSITYQAKSLMMFLKSQIGHGHVIIHSSYLQGNYKTSGTDGKRKVSIKITNAHEREIQSKHVIFE